MQQEREAERQVPLVWVAADYHFPSTYSCRIPMSSMSSAPVMPAPGPATVRLALIKTGIECDGLDTVRDELYPILRWAPVRVRPPERVAISQHLLRGYKWSEDRAKRRTVQESIMVREMAHASGPMTVYLQVPQECERRLSVVLRAVGYWGQSSSLACCLGVREAPPVPGESALPLTRLNGTIHLRPTSPAWPQSSAQTGSRGMSSLRARARTGQRRSTATSTSGRWSPSIIRERKSCWCASP